MKLSHVYIGAAIAAVVAAPAEAQVRIGNLEVPSGTNIRGMSIQSRNGEIINAQGIPPGSVLINPRTGQRTPVDQNGQPIQSPRMASPLMNSPSSHGGIDSPSLFPNSNKWGPALGTIPGAGVNGSIDNSDIVVQTEERPAEPIKLAFESNIINLYCNPSLLTWDSPNFDVKKFCPTLKNGTKFFSLSHPFTQVVYGQGDHRNKVAFCKKEVAAGQGVFTQVEQGVRAGRDANCYRFTIVENVKQPAKPAGKAKAAPKPA